MRKYGLTVDNLRGVELVTADGDHVRADARIEPELFWGLRGGGGNFGIATAFEYDLHRLGPMVLGGSVFWDSDDGPAVMRRVREYVREAPDELGIAFAMMLAPPIPTLPPDRVLKPAIVLVLVWAGDPADGHAALAPLREVGRPLADSVAVVPYGFIQSMLDGGAPHGRHYYWKSHRLPDLSDPVVDVFLERLAAMTSPFAQITGWAMGGAVSRVDPAATAVGEREDGFDVSFATGWLPTDPEPERHKQWSRVAWDALQPHSAGIYANFISDEGEAGVEAAYGDRRARLSALKASWDPDNVFRMNANIRPSVEAVR
jgi:FAD/FMN-containing dehydrogenase